MNIVIKTEDKSKSGQFKDVLIGEVFRNNDALFIKTTSDSAFNLKARNLWFFEPTISVQIPTETTLTVTFP